jgi:hypothetical protein
MAEDPRNAPPLQCSDIVFRAVAYPNLVRGNGSHKNGVFYRREDKDPNGLSVTTTIAACKAQFTDAPICGVRSLHIGLLRDRGFDTLPSPCWPTHANIQNIPIRKTDELAARNIAELLLEISRPVDNWQADNADELFQQNRNWDTTPYRAGEFPSERNF